MFRKRAPSNPAHKNPPSASASLAATKAFVRDRDSNASLSSAAAAAALRTHTSSPTPVGDTITKRMARKSSVSSRGSASQRPPGLRRHSSSGSMTERSFRAPSPGARGSPVPAPPNAPPVPNLPADVPDTSAVHRRASSLEPLYRTGSPAGRGGGRGLSLDRGIVAMPGRGARAAHLSQVPEDDYNDSPRSVNFSRPISPPASPPPPTSPHQRVASQRTANSGWFSGPVVNPNVSFRGAKPRPKPPAGAMGQDPRNPQQAIQNAADGPVKKTQVLHGVEGHRLSSGSMRAKPSGSAVPQRQALAQPPHAPAVRPRIVDPKSPYAVYDPSTRTFIHKQDAMALHRQLSEEEGDQTQGYVAHHVTGSQEYLPQHQPSPARNAIQKAPHPPPQPVQRAASPTHQLRIRTPTPESEAKPDETAVRPPTPPTPPPAQSQSVAFLPRRSSEEFAGSDIKPAAYAGERHSLETAVAEPVRESSDTPVSPKIANQDGPYPRISTPVIPPSETLAGQVRGSVRTHSLSPPRNAHFAAVAVELPSGIKHQPPPRSVSPAKSALKASPSVSRRDSSPHDHDRHIVGRGAPSETSDTISEDGRKKKRHVRVSFDDEAVIAGTSAYPEAETTTSPIALGSSRWSSAKHDQDLDDVLQPRPVLPFFGSIRQKNRRLESSDVPEKVTETVSSSMSASVASVASVGEPVEAPSDLALGGILAHDFAEKAAKSSNDDPLPPEVTSVEGTGSISDSGESDAYEPQQPYVTKTKHQAEPSVLHPEPKSLTMREHTPLIPEVPAIAVQPASPSPAVEKPEFKFSHPSLPGGWGNDQYEEEQEEGKMVRPDSKPAAPATEARKPVIQPQVQNDDSSDDDHSSIYSDAYEELTDSEDGGFGSIDAVIESPDLHPTSSLMSSKYADDTRTESPQSNLRNEYVPNPQQQEPSATPIEDQNVRQQRNVVGQSQVEDSQPRVTAKQPTSVTKPAAKPASRPIKSTAKDKSSIEPIAARSSRNAEAPAQPRTSAMKTSVGVQHAYPSHPHLRKSMRSGTDTERPLSSGQMKKTMRSNTGPSAVPTSETHVKRSVRTTEPAGPSGLAASRYSMAPSTKPPKAALQKKHIPPATGLTKARPQSATMAAAYTVNPPVPTYDSDSGASASSFQRSRPRASRKQDGGRHTMRASMRSAAAPTMRTAPTMRPKSPPKATSPPPTALRKSLRPTSPTEPAGARSSRFSIRSLSPTGRFRSKGPVMDAPASPNKAPPKMPTFGKAKSKFKAPEPESSKSRFASRFDDSSDEDDYDRRGRFQSRFADSDDDDDELPPGLTPVRGIPRKPGKEDGDSTDLEEEISDNETSPRRTASNVEKNGTAAANGVTNGRGANFAAESLGKSKHAPELPSFEAGKKSKSKRGFFGLGKRKSAAGPATEPALGNANAASDIPPPEHRNRTRPLTPINEDKDVEPRRPSPRSPKLQRRSMQPRSTSDSSWPLAEPPKIGENERPRSSDGIIPRRISLRPALHKRHSSQISEARTVPDSRPDKGISIGHTGKKKKFQGLRRVFGLND